MAEYRTLRMSFWNDPYIEAADPLRKLVYLYLITCPHTNNLGVLEVSTRRIAFEVGADADAVEKCLAAIAGDGKILRDGCVIWLVSFIKHQTSTSFKIIQGLRGLLRSVTSDAIRSAITKAYPQIFSAKQPETGDTCSDGMDTVSKGHGYPIDTLSIPIAEEEREEEREEEEESSLNSKVLPLTEGSSNSKRSASAPSPGAARKRKGSDGEGYRTKKGRILSGLRLESFERFWRAFDYPRGKSEAADAWYDIQPMTHALVAQIVEAAEREASVRPALVASGRTPKMAQGWLTGRRWEDGEEPVPRVMNEAGRRVEANKAAAQGGFELLKQSGFFAHQQAQGGAQ